MFRVVTVAREYGSGGGAIAKRLAEQLGWKILDRSLITEIAQKMQITPAFVEQLDERRDPWLYRLAKQTFHYGTLEGSVDPSQVGAPDADRIAALTRRLIGEAASLGQCVIVGRGGQCILQERRDTFHVFVYASREERIVRLRQRVAPDADPAALLESADREGEAYIRHYFQRDWSDRYLYHMMLNSTIGEEAAVSVILQAMAVPETRE